MRRFAVFILFAMSTYIYSQQPDVIVKLKTKDYFSNAYGKIDYYHFKIGQILLIDPVKKVGFTSGYCLEKPQNVSIIEEGELYIKNNLEINVSGRVKKYEAEIVSKIQNDTKFTIKGANAKELPNPREYLIDASIKKDIQAHPNMKIIVVYKVLYGDQMIIDNINAKKLQGNLQLLRLGAGDILISYETDYNLNIRGENIPLLFKYKMVELDLNKSVLNQKYEEQIDINDIDFSSAAMSID